MPDQFTFPAAPHINEIPVWINFSSIAYDKVKSREERNGSPTKYCDEATVVASVPFNGSFTNSNKLNYTNNPMEVLTLMGLGDMTNAGDIRLRGLAQMLEQNTKDDSLGLIAQTAAGTPGKDQATSNTYMSVDMMDMMFLGGGNRGYQIEFDLVCRSPQDSYAAGQLCGALSSQCWPLLNISGNANGNAKLKHPDIWAISLSEFPGQFGGEDQFNNLWNDGVGPQLCVLTDVLTKRVGGENSRILGINRNRPNSRQQSGTGDPAPLPLWYKVSLSFIELEPTIRIGGYKAINRSSAFGNRSPDTPVTPG